METSQQLNRGKVFYRASGRQRLRAAIAFLIIGGAFGMFRLAADGKIDIERYLMPCGLKQNYGIPCPTCGMTGATLAFVKGKILQAFYIQPAAAFLWCILCAAAFFAFITAVPGIYFRFMRRFFHEVTLKRTILLVVIVVAAGWAVTLARAFAESGAR
ncbi:MAG: DUF2752 domain-containing protein [Phycisphaerales bacterium]|nr:MAG: DUF2752 domain-containing protein [Phycisphaerales bacterium]